MSLATTLPSHPGVRGHCPDTCLTDPWSPSVLRRIKVTFLDTVVRVEHVPGDGDRGVAVEVHVQR